MAQFEINNTDAATLGITFLEGTYNELTKPPVPKDGLVNDWASAHGKERDLTARYFKSRQLALPIMIEGNSVADFLTKKQAFNTLLMSGYFTLKCYDLNRQYTLVYIDASNFIDYSTFCNYTLLVEDDSPQLNTPIV